MSQASNHSFIYVLENTVNGSVYVGKANSVERRWKRHVAESKRGSKNPVHRAIAKYGESSFIVHIVDDHADEEYVLSVLEPAWISYLKLMGINVYNLTDGGEGISGFHHSDESKKKISVKNRGRTVSDEMRAHLSEKVSGFKHAEETRAKISDAVRGKKKPPRSESHREALSRAASERVFTEERRRNLSEAMKRSEKVGHPVDEETRRKISESLKGKTQSEETRNKRAESLRNQSPEAKAKRAQSIRAAWARRKAQESELS